MRGNARQLSVLVRRDRLESFVFITVQCAIDWNPEAARSKARATLTALKIVADQQQVLKAQQAWKMSVGSSATLTSLSLSTPTPFRRRTESFVSRNRQHRPWLSYKILADTDSRRKKRSFF